MEQKKISITRSQKQGQWVILMKIGLANYQTCPNDCDSKQGMTR